MFIQWTWPIAFLGVLAIAASSISTGAEAPTVANFTLPLQFEPNVGQAAAGVKYVAGFDGYNIAVTEQGVFVGLPPQAATEKQSPLHLSLAGGASNARLRAERPMSSVSNYFVGRDPSKWRRGVANFGAVRYENVYPGIDWVIYGTAQHLEYDLVVAPHADPGLIKLQIDGAEQIRLDGNGDLLVGTRHHTLRQLKPVIYQRTAGGRKDPIRGHFILDHQQVAFELGDYDRGRALIIDPELVYSTYFGGSTADGVRTVTVGADGSAYVAGTTRSKDFPVVSAFQSAADVHFSFSTSFVAKFDPTGHTLVYSTYLGGSGSATDTGGDFVGGIAVDSAGSAYVIGSTTSADFPTTLNAIQKSKKSAAGKDSVFVSKLSPRGDALVYSTYLGGSASDYGNAIALSGTGEAFVAGTAVSTDFPTTAGAFQGTKTGVTGFVAKISSAGDRLEYSTYLGGTGITDSSEGVNSIAVDASGNAYVTGMTSAADFPTMNPLTAPKSGAVIAVAPDAFVTKLNAVGTALLFSTYLGGASIEDPASIAVDNSGNVYVAGSTRSTDFPVVNAFRSTDPSTAHEDTGFVTKLNPTTSVLVYSTYLGGSLHDGITSLAVDPSGNAFVGGFTESTDFPTVNPIQATHRGTARLAFNGFLAQLNSSGNELLFGTYLGGSGSVAHIPTNPAGASAGDVVDSIALDKDGNLLVAGSTASPDFPLANAYQGQIHTQGSDATGFVTKVKMTPPAQGGGGGLGGTGGGGAINWGLVAVLGLALAARRRLGTNGLAYATGTDIIVISGAFVGP